MENIILFDIFKEKYGIEKISNMLKVDKCDYDFYKIKDDFYVVFLEVMFKKSDTMALLEYFDKVFMDCVDANIIVVSNTYEFFTDSDCLFYNGKNLYVDFLLRNVTTNRYMCCKSRFGNPFSRIIRDIMKSIDKN